MLTKINDSLYINTNGLRIAQAKKLNENWLITCQYEDGRSVNFNVDSEGAKNDVLAKLSKKPTTRRAK